MGGEGVGGAAGDFTDPVVGGQVDLTGGSGAELAPTRS